MNTEEAIRRALVNEAEKHPVNHVLDRSTIAKARISRFAAVIGAGAIVAAIAFGAVGIVSNLGGSTQMIQPSSGSEEPGGGTDTRRDAPLLLITEEGWRVTRADEYGVKSGEVSFTNGDQEIELFWRPANTHEDYVDDRADQTIQHDITIAGQEGILFEGTYEHQGTRVFTALWLDGPLSLELRGGFATIDDYRSLAETLDFVDEETWLSALPEGTVTASERGAVVDGMLRDIPVHPSVDIDELKTLHTVSDRYQVGAQVTGAVACAWIKQWVNARENDNDAAAQEASDAMATSRRWAILKEMKSQGGWSGVLWDYADAITSNDSIMGGRSLTVEESYKSALGCPGAPEDGT